MNFAFMRESKLYTKQVQISRPRPDKSLQLKWITFRDKLQPGGKEEWQLQITHPDKKAADAQLLATLYDASPFHSRCPCKPDILRSFHLDVQ